MFDDKPLESGPSIAKARAKDDTPIGRLQSRSAEDVVDKPDDYQDEASVQLHSRLLAYYRQELSRQEVNRAEMAIDEDFYDNEQWRREDEAAIRARGQVPLVYNVIATTVNWVIGTEKRSRTQYRVLPRRKEDGKSAERKTQLMKYLSDVNREPFHKSRAFEDAVKAGLGWLECGVQDDDDGEPVYVRYESWRNLLWDSASTERDLSDARYVFRVKWVDLDVARAIFPKATDVLTRSAIDGDRYATYSESGDRAMDSQEDALDIYGSDVDGYAYNRQRVRMIECWYRAPAATQRLRGGVFSGDMFEPDNTGHAEAVRSGNSVVVEKVSMRMHVAILTTRGLVHVSRSPYRHNAFPFTPIWGYRRGRDNMPYGMIRGLRSIQEDINKRASKALAILSSNKVIMDEGAVDDLDEFAEEVARPDAIIVKKPNKALEINADRDLAEPHLEFMARSIQMIQQTSGVTDELRGMATNARSGVAIQARQNQGSVSTAGIFDNLRLAYQVNGEKELSLIEQYFTEQKDFRITNMRGQPDYVTINDGMPENDIIRTKADFIISEDDWRATIRQAQTDELIGLMQQVAPVAPQIVLTMLDLVVESMDVPNRDELVKRIRQVTGMQDPDADEPSQDQIAKAQQAAQQQALQMALLQAQVADKQASAAQKQAAAQKSQVDAKSILAGLAGKNVDTQLKALQAAITMLQAGHAVPVADGVLHESGFVGRTEAEQDQAQQAAQAVQQAMAAQQAQAKQDRDASRAASNIATGRRFAQQRAEAGSPDRMPAPDKEPMW